MKKLLILALLAGCASSTPVASTTPTPEVVEAPEPGSEYVGVVSLLKTLIDFTPEQFTDFCGNINGTLTTDSQYTTCAFGPMTGFTLEFDTTGTSSIAVMVMPGEVGQDVANAVVEEVGEPAGVFGNEAVWDLGEYQLLFTAFPGAPAWILGLERVGINL